MKCLWSEVWATAHGLPWNYSSSPFLRIQKNGQDSFWKHSMWERGTANMWWSSPYYIYLLGTEASTKMGFGLCKMKLSSFFVVSPLCPTVSTMSSHSPFDCISELEFSHGKILYMESLNALWRMLERPRKGLTSSKMYYWHFSNWIDTIQYPSLGIMV